MRKFKREIEINGKIVNRVYSSQYSKRFKWRIILPEQVVIKLDDCLKNNPPVEDSDFTFKREVALYLLNLITYFASKNKDKKYEGGYVTLCSEYLKKKHSRYNKYFKYFLDNEIIEKKDNYSNFKGKEYCKSYRYNYKKLGNLTFKIFDIDFEKKFYNKIMIATHEIQQGNEHLTKWLNPKLEVDVDAVFYEIQTITKHIRTEEQKTLKKAEHYLYSLKCLQDNEYWATRKKDTDNRLHTNLTNMSKFFRNYITYDGEALSGVDIKNSQPFFLMVLIETLLIKFSKNTYLEKKNDRDSGESERNRKGIIIKNVILNSGTMFPEIPRTLSSSGFQKEYSELKTLIINGKIYEDLVSIFYNERKDIFKKQKNPKNGKKEFARKFFNADIGKMETFYFEDERSLMKRLVLFFFYKSNNTKGDNDYNIFKAKFPNFCELLETLKAENYKLLPKVLQHLEADCVLDYTCKQIAEKYPDMPLFTIHDSIITTWSNYELLEQEVRRLMVEYCDGIKPTLKREDWCKDCPKELAA